MALVNTRIFSKLETMPLQLPQILAIMIGVVGGNGLLLALAHGIEAAVWAIAYIRLGALGSLFDATFYSLDSMTTRGASELALPSRWRMMGALEATDGILLFGISTAFMFAVMQVYWPILKERTGGVSNSTAADTKTRRS